VLELPLARLDKKESSMEYPMKSKPYRFLTRLLIALLAFVFIILPLIWSIRDGEIIGLSLPMGAIGIWLLGAGKINLLGVQMEGRQAFSVGGALLAPIIIAGIVNNSILPGWIALVGILTGLAASIILYFKVQQTKLSEDRTTALILSSAGIVLALLGTALSGPSDQGGTILVEGIPIVPFNSAATFLQVLGLMVFLAGLFGLIFGFNSKK
jgi:hypothetical protein